MSFGTGHVCALLEQQIEKRSLLHKLGYKPQKFYYTSNNLHSYLFISAISL